MLKIRGKRYLWAMSIILVVCLLFSATEMVAEENSGDVQVVETAELLQYDDSDRIFKGDSLGSSAQSIASTSEVSETLDVIVTDLGQEKEEIRRAEEEAARKAEEERLRLEAEAEAERLRQEMENQVQPVDEVTAEGRVTYSGDGSCGQFKSYMDKDCITARGSLEYSLKESATLNENGVACVDGRMLIAIGTGHGVSVGENIDVYLTSGKVLHCKMGDTKSNRDTGPDNIVHASDRSIIEFIVETSCMNRKAKQMGDMSYAGYEGGIVKVVKVD